MQNYQMKLNFGESEELHLAYENWLEITGEQDNPTNWEVFKGAWQIMTKDYDT
jgi:hypothetical protein